MTAREIGIVEVGPRDGLQAEATVLPVAIRVDLIRRLERAGVRRMEVVSFANPERVPQMAGAEEIAAAIADRTFSAIGLVLNERGLERAAACGLDEVNLVAYAADGYAEKNSGKSASARNDEAASLVALAKQAGHKVTVTIAIAFGDPFEGRVPPERVAGIAAAMAEAGADEIALGDTIGVGVPATVGHLVARLVESLPSMPIRCHFHNTYNTGYANAFAAIEAGCTVLDGSVGGYGGSPFSPGAGGNVATEDLALMLDRSGLTTGIDPAAMGEIGSWLARELGHDQPPAMIGRTAVWPPMTD